MVARNVYTVLSSLSNEVKILSNKFSEVDKKFDEVNNKLDKLIALNTSRKRKRRKQLRSIF